MVVVFTKWFVGSSLVDRFWVFFNTGNGIFSAQFTMSGSEPGGKTCPWRQGWRFGLMINWKVAKIWSGSYTRAQKQRKAANQAGVCFMHVHRCLPTILLDIQVHGRYCFNLLARVPHTSCQMTKIFWKSIVLCRSDTNWIWGHLPIIYCVFTAPSWVPGQACRTPRAPAVAQR